MEHIHPHEKEGFNYGMIVSFKEGLNIKKEINIPETPHVISKRIYMSVQIDTNYHYKEESVKDVQTSIKMDGCGKLMFHNDINARDYRKTLLKFF